MTARPLAARVLAVLALAVSPVLAAPPGAVGPVTLDAVGGMKIGAIKATLTHFDDAWSGATQARIKPRPGFPKSSAGRWEMQADFPSRSDNVPFALTQTLEQSSGDVRVKYRLTHPTGVGTRAMVLGLVLPSAEYRGKAIRFDDKAVTLPAETQKQEVFSGRDIKRIVLPIDTGTLELTGNFGVYVQDERAMSGNDVTLRLYFSPGSGNLKDASLDFTLRHTPYVSRPLPLGNAANVGFRDDKADDQTGGWTDQGPENDLSPLKAGPLQAGGIRFDVSAADKSAIALAGPQRDYFPKSVTIPVSGSEPARNLYLLHATAWTPAKGTSVGKIVATYADGSTSEVDVKARVDVTNWWNPPALPNGFVAWTGENRSANVGLLASKFPLANKPLKSLRFDSAETGVWLIAGVTVSPDEIPLPTVQTQPVVTTAGADWQPFVASLDVAEGSVFDLSFFADAPAGKHGPIRITEAGHFEFENLPGKRQKFWGVNTCFTANYLPHEESDKLADRLVRRGYNSVRIHHYDQLLPKKDGLSYEFDPEQVDRLNYLFAALKKRWLYISIDLYSGRNFKAVELKEINRPGRHDFKAILPVSESAFESWKQFVSNLMLTKNPYTGMTWAEDPALIGICPINEDTIHAGFSYAPDIRAVYEKRFAEHLQQENLKPATAAESAVLFNKFLIDLQLKNDQRLRDFLHEKGIKTPLTGANWQVGKAQTINRATYDFVDNHGYWDHPNFPVQQWRLPFAFHGRSAVAAAAETPRTTMPTRVIGKPYTFTEFNFVYPNPYRAEGGPVMGAYAALQDWDAVYNFAFAHKDKNATSVQPVDGFDINTDPLAMMAERISLLMYLRGDVKPATTFVPFAVTEKSAYGTVKGTAEAFPRQYGLLGLITRVGSFVAEGGLPPTVAGRENVKAVVADDDVPAAKLAGQKLYRASPELLSDLAKDGVIPAESVDAGGKRFTSTTGQIELQTSPARLRVVTDRSECFSLFKDARDQGKAVTVVNGPEGFAVVFVAAMDDLPIASSKRLMVLHLTDLVNTGSKFSSPARVLLEDFGKLPHLLRQGSATVTIRREGDAALKAWPLDAEGKRGEAMPVRAEGGNLTLDLKTLTPGRATMAYELAAE
jgi:hypothetical protein